MRVCNPSLNKKYFVKAIEYFIASSEHSQGEFLKDMPTRDAVEVFIPLQEFSENTCKNTYER